MRRATFPRFLLSSYHLAQFISSRSPPQLYKVKENSSPTPIPHHICPSAFFGPPRPDSQFSLLPSLEHAKQYLQKCGLRSKSRIVLWEEQRLKLAPRVLLSLKCLGFQKVALLNDALSPELSSFFQNQKVKSFSEEEELRLNKQFLIDRESLINDAFHSLAGNKEAQIVDTRPQKDYLAFSESKQPVEMNVHGAISLPEQELYERESQEGFRRVLPLKKLNELFVSKKIKVSQSMIFYSQEGTSASLGAVCGWDMGAEVKVYEGGWREYSAYEIPDLREKAAYSEDMLNPISFIAKRHQMMREEGEEETVNRELIHVERINYLRRLEDKERRAQDRKRERAKRERRERYDLFGDYGDSD